MNKLLTWFPWFRSVTTKDVFSTFNQHQSTKSRTFVITAAMKVSRPFAIGWSAVQQRTSRIRRQPWLKSWRVGFIRYYQRGAEKTRRRSRLLFQLLNDTLNLIKLSLFKQFFFNSVIWQDELTIAKVVQNVPESMAKKWYFSVNVNWWMNKSTVIINATLLPLASIVLYELFCPPGKKSHLCGGSSKCTFTWNKQTSTNQDRFQPESQLFSTCGLSRISGETGSGRRFSKFVTTVISWREEERGS